MKKKEVLFSIIIPIYNEGRNISKVFDSYLNQGYIDYEIIAVDDGSTDECVGICDAYDESYDFFHVYHKENAGCVFARKYGIDRAHGKYIVFADGDDYVEPDYIENLHKAVEHEADYYILNNKLNYPGTTEYYVEKDFLEDGYVNVENVYHWLLTAKAGAVWDKIFITKLIRQESINFSRRISYGEDVYINLKYVEHVNSVYVQNTSSYNHITDSATSICTHNITEKRFAEIDSLFQEVMEEKSIIAISDRTMQEYYYMVTCNLLTTVYALIMAGSKRAAIIWELEKLESFQYLKKNYKAQSIKGKLYSFLLGGCHITFIKLLFIVKK